MESYRKLLFRIPETVVKTKQDSLKELTNQFNNLVDKAIDAQVITGVRIGEASNEEIGAVDIRAFHKKISGE